MILRCRTCARGHSEGPCQGSPQEATCYCRQCHTRTIMKNAREAMEGNNLAKIRAALEGVYALQFQTMVQRQRQAQRQPGIARCASCGKPVSVRRRPRLGEPVYCRRSSTCRWHAWAKRQRERQEQCPTPTAGQIPEAAREGAQETAPDQPIVRLLAGDDLSAAFRVG